MKRSAPISLLLGMMTLASASASSAGPGGRFISVVKGEGRRLERQIPAAEWAAIPSAEVRWGDLSRRPWLPPLGIGGGGDEGTLPREVCIADAGEACRPVPVVVEVAGRMDVAGHGAAVCTVLLRDAEFAGEGRAAIDEEGRPLAGTFKFVRHAPSSPWDVVLGATAATDEIDVAWSVIP